MGPPRHARSPPSFIDPATDGPLPGREDQWGIITGYRVRLAMAARDWPTATRLQNPGHRPEPGAGRRRAGHPGQPAHPRPAQPDPHPRRLPPVPRPHPQRQEDPGCLPHFQEALGLLRRIQARPRKPCWPLSLGNAYTDVPGLRDLDQAERWYQHSLDLKAEHDRLGRAKILGSLATVAA